MPHAGVAAIKLRDEGLNPGMSSRQVTRHLLVSTSWRAHREQSINHTDIPPLSKVVVENDSDQWTRHSHTLLKPLVVERSLRSLSSPTRYAKLNPRDTGILY